MKIELIRKSSTNPREMTLGQLLVDGVMSAYTIEPPIEGRGMKAATEGRYKIVLSGSNEPGSLIPYAIGVPSIGAVPIGYKSKRHGDPRESYIRVAETHDRLDSHSAEDYELWCALLSGMKFAHSDGDAISIEVRTETAKAIELEDEPTVPVGTSENKQDLPVEKKSGKQ